jgi:hypothetical protein
MNTIHIVVLGVAIAVVVYFGYTEIKRLNKRIDEIVHNNARLAHDADYIKSMPIKQPMEYSVKPEALSNTNTNNTVDKQNEGHSVKFDNESECDSEHHEEVEQESESESESESEKESEQESECENESIYIVNKDNTTDSVDGDDITHDKIYNNCETDPMIMNYLQSVISPTDGNTNNLMTSSIDKYEIIQDAMTQSEYSTETLKNKTIKQLKDILNKMKLSTAGNKNILIARILTAF